MSPEPVAGEEVLAALERTVRCRSARIEVRFQISWGDAFLSESGRTSPRGGSVRRRLTRWAGAVVGQMLNSGMQRLLKRLSKTLAQGVVGILDFEANRCVYYMERSKAESKGRSASTAARPGTSRLTQT